MEVLKQPMKLKVIYKERRYDWKSYLSFPYFLADIEKEIFGNENVPTRSEVMQNLIPYIQDETSKGTQLNHIMRHTVGLSMDKMDQKFGNNIFLKICA